MSHNILINYQELGENQIFKRETVVWGRIERVANIDYRILHRDVKQDKGKVGVGR